MVREDVWDDFRLFQFADLICSMLCSLSWKNIPYADKKMCILQLLDEMFYKWPVRSIYPTVPFNSDVSSLTFCLNDLSLAENGELKSSTVTALECIPPIRCLPSIFGWFCVGCVCIYNCDILLLNLLSKYNLRLCLQFFIQTVLFDIRLATAACFWFPCIFFFYLLTFSLRVFVK